MFAYGSNTTIFKDMVDFENVFDGGGKLKEHRYVDLMSKYIPCLVFHVGVVTISLHKHFQRLLLIMLKTVNETISKSCSS